MSKGDERRRFERQRHGSQRKEVPLPERSRQRWVDAVKSDLQMSGVINGEELANDRGGVSVAAKELNGLY